VKESGESSAMRFNEGFKSMFLKSKAETSRQYTIRVDGAGQSMVVLRIRNVERSA